MNIHAILAIWKRQLGSMLLNPLGYVFILAFVTISTGFLLVPDAYFRRNIADLGLLTTYMPWFLVVLLPALSMGSWASERELGTEEHLLTLPLSVGDALLGKWLGVATFFTLALCVSYVNHAVWISQLGEPDWGLLLANYAGWWLAGLFLAALGLFASTLVMLPSVAFVLGVIFSAAALGVLWRFEWFDPFNRGLLPAGGFVSAGMAIVLALGGAWVSVACRRWTPTTDRFIRIFVAVLAAVYAGAGTVLLFQGYLSGPLFGLIGLGVLLVWALVAVPRPFILHGLVAIFLAVTLVNVSVQADRRAADLDATSEKLSSLSAGSLKILNELKDPVTVTAFISKALPEDLVLKGREVESVLKQLERQSNGRIKLDLRRPADPLDPDGLLATQQYGFTPRKVLDSTTTGREETDAFLGVAARAGARMERIDHFDPGLSVEYELLRAIRAVSTAKKKIVGVVSTDLKITGTFDFMSGTPRPDWECVLELKKQYEVREVSLDTPVDAEIAVLVVPQPSRLSEEKIRKLHDYVWEGRPALILEDPLPSFSGPQLGSSQPKRPANPMMGGPQPDPEKGDLQPLLRALGLEWNYEQLLWSDFNPSHYFRNLWPRTILCTYRDQGGILDHSATRGIDSLLFPFPGAIRTDKDKSGEITVTALVQPVTGANWGTHLYSDYMRGERKHKYIPDGGVQAAVAVSVTGKLKRVYPLEKKADEKTTAKSDEVKTGEAKSAEAKTGAESEKKEAQPEGLGQLGEKPVHVIVIADTDFIHNQFFSFYRADDKQLTQDDLRFLADLRNVQFLANCVDVLAGDSELVEMRTRRAMRRPLSTQEDVLKRTQQTLREAESLANNDAKAKIDAANKDFKARIDKIDENKEWDESTKDQYRAQVESTANRQLEADIKEIERNAEVKIREAKIAQQREIESSRFTVRLGALLGPAVVLLLFAIGVLVYRLYGESLSVPDSRRRND